MGRLSKRDVRRSEIVGAFARVLAEHGYAGATIQAVAAEADISPGLLHHNFKNKQEMLDELLMLLRSKFRTRISVTANDNGGAIEKYIDAALKLDSRSDLVESRCWVGLFAESLRDPKLFAKMKRYFQDEADYIGNIGGNDLNEQSCGAMLAFIVGALVLGSFIPKTTAGFAAEAGRLRAKSLK